MNSPASHDALPPPAGPYSQWARRDSMAALAGPPGTDHAGHLGASAAEQIRQALSNPRTAVHAAGAGVADVISVRVNLADPGDFAGLNRCCPETFGHPYPARTTGGARLPPGVLAGIDALAVTRPGAGHRYGHHG